MPVICYHSVDPDWESPLAVTPESFADQCRWLAEHREVVDSRDLVPAVAAGRHTPPRAVSLTFDDGFAAVLEHALPVLTRHKLPSMMFLVAGTLEAPSPRADWLRPQPSPGPLVLDKDQVLAMKDAGVTFGSHTWAHHDLRELSEAECVIDLRESREAIEDLLHEPVEMLAYPYGFHAPHVRRAAEAAGYRYALSLPEGHETTGRSAVPRVGVYRGNSVTALRVKSSRWYLGARMARSRLPGMSRAHDSESPAVT